MRFLQIRTAKLAARDFDTFAFDKFSALLQRVGCPKKIGSFTYHARVINEQKDDCLGTSCPWFFAQNANYCACDVAHGCCLMSDAVIEESKEKKRLFAH